MTQPIRIAVTGGAGQICYSLLFRIAAGEIFGPKQKVALHILELPSSLTQLKGVVLEIEDCAFPLLTEVVVGDNAEEVFEGVDYAILVGAKPRSKGMERKDLLLENAKIFVAQGKALNRKGVKVLVVGNPCNTNALVLHHNAPNLPFENIRSMMRLDQNRAVAQFAKKASVEASDVKKVAVYGNHSPTMVVDYNNALIKGKKVTDVITDIDWLRGECMTRVQKRGAEIIETRGLSSAASAANAVIDSIRDWHFETPSDNWYTAGIYSTGNPYKIKDDLFFSFPIRNNKIVDGLIIDDFLVKKVEESEKELLEEREAVRSYLKGM